MCHASVQGVERMINVKNKEKITLLIPKKYLYLDLLFLIIIMQ